MIPGGEAPSPPDEDRIALFVYGTLRTGFWNHRLYLTPALELGRAERVAEATTVDAFPLLLFGERHIPGLLHLPGHGSHVRGEVYLVEPAILGGLSVVEGVHTGLYSKASIEVETAPGMTRRCTTFVVGPSAEPLELDTLAQRLPGTVHLAWSESRRRLLSEYLPSEYERYRPRDAFLAEALARILGIETAEVEAAAANARPEEHPDIWKRLRRG